MSSKVVRDEFYDAWLSLVPGIPFHKTINIDPDHSDMEDLWVTAEFVAFNESPISLGNPSCRRETGTITVDVSSKSGEGEDTLNEAIDTIRTAFRHWATAGIRVTQVDPPLPDSGFSNGMYYIMTVDISYTYDLFV